MAALTGWPTDGAEGSVSSEARWRKMAKLWAPSGVVTGLTPTTGAGVLNVAAGSAWVDGHYCELLTPASETNSANGLLVIRFTPADNTFELVYRDGVTTPTQTEATFELPIAQMAAGVMTDLRAVIGAQGAIHNHFADSASVAIASGTAASVATVALAVPWASWRIIGNWSFVISSAAAAVVDITTQIYLNGALTNNQWNSIGAAETTAGASRYSTMAGVFNLVGTGTGTQTLEVRALRAAGAAGPEAIRRMIVVTGYQRG